MQAQNAAPADDPQCGSTERNKEKEEQSLLFMERAEQSLLFITAAGVVCQIGDHEWYGLCMLTLAMLASGDLWAQVKEEEGPPYLREKRATSQENYYLEAYNCNEPEETTAYPIPQQCLKLKEPVSSATFSGTK